MALIVFFFVIFVCFGIATTTIGGPLQIEALLTPFKLLGVTFVNDELIVRWCVFVVRTPGIFQRRHYYGGGVIIDLYTRTVDTTTMVVWW